MNSVTWLSFNRLGFFPTKYSLLFFVVVKGSAGNISCSFSYSSYHAPLNWRVGLFSFFLLWKLIVLAWDHLFSKKDGKATAHVMWMVFEFIPCSYWKIEANFKNFFNCVLGFSKLEKGLILTVQHFHICDVWFEDEPHGKQIIEEKASALGFLEEKMGWTKLNLDKT